MDLNDCVNDVQVNSLQYYSDLDEIHVSLEVNIAPFRVTVRSLGWHTSWMTSFSTSTLQTERINTEFRTHPRMYLLRKTSLACALVVECRCVISLGQIIR